MIRVDRLSFTYAGETPALCGLSVSIHAGERVAVIGPNGSGKSTFARCLNGLLQPTDGSVEVDGLSTADPASVYDIRQRLGLVFQNPDDQLVSTTVESEIAFGLENLGTPHPAMVENVEATLHRFHLDRYRHHPPHLLSGGEKQRLAIAACVALQSRYMVLDEPTALLDPTSRREVMALLQTLHEQGVTPIHITQAPAEAARADRVIVMDAGTIVMDGPPAEVFARAGRLQEIGLDAPFAATLATDLQARGVDVGGGHLETEALEPLLAELLSGTSRPRTDAEPAVKAGPALEPKLSVRDLRFAYEVTPGQRVEALAGIDMDIPAASAVAVIGPSGSGKTTLAQHLNGLLRPASGQVCVDGRDIWSLPDQSVVRAQVGLVFQFPELQLFEETLADDVAFGPRNLGCDASSTAARVREALEIVGLPLEAYGDRSPLSLSAGQRRRAAIAGVLAMQPQVLVLDEPTAGLDPRTAQTLRDIFDHLRQSGRTLVLISHDMDLVAELATHVVVMCRGRIVLSGPVREVLANPDFETLSDLEPPATVALMRGLRRRGCSVPDDLIRHGDVVAYLAAHISARKGERDA